MQAGSPSPPDVNRAPPPEKGEPQRSTVLTFSILWIGFWNVFLAIWLFPRYSDILGLLGGIVYWATTLFVYLVLAAAWTGDPAMAGGVRILLFIHLLSGAGETTTGHLWSFETLIAASLAGFDGVAVHELEKRAKH